MMTDTLFHQSTHFIDAPLQPVFDAALAGARPVDGQTVDFARFGALLDVRHVSGTPGQVGAQHTARFNFGAVDLEMIETVESIDPARRIVVEQLPDRFRLFDRTERVLPFSHAIPDDIQMAFDQSFGDPATPTLITFDFALRDDGTEIMITVQADNRPKRGWFGRRRWQKDVTEMTRGIALRIWQQLQVQ